MPELITLGETMAAFTSCENGPLRYADRFAVRIAGAESNTAVGIQKLGHTAGWISRVGNDEFGALVLNRIRAEGVDTSGVITDPAHPTGLMFKERRGIGDPRVYYYRAGSAASFLSPKDLSEAYIKSARILHLTGITPVLSGSCREAVEQAFFLAHQNGQTISFDPNIRRRLWNEERDVPILRALCLRADIVLLGMEEAYTLFPVSSPQECCDYLFRHGSAENAAVKLGADGAFCAQRGKDGFLSEPFACKVSDTVGAGDAFNAGFLSGLLESLSVKECARRGNAAGALAVQTQGDIEGLPERGELLNLLCGHDELTR